MSTSYTIFECLQKASARLKIAGSDTPRLDAELMLGKTLSCDRVYLINHSKSSLNDDTFKLFESFVRRRESLEPMAYILGVKEFMGLEFEVNPSVLIPRPDSEILLEAVLAFLKKEKSHSAKILDIGTGSGCLAISLCYFLQETQVTAWDISERALECAQKNAKNILGSSHTLNFRAVDALNKKNWEKSEAFDLIMSNPPYIANFEKPLLCKGVVNFEPHQALFAQEDGLEFYIMMARYAHKLLNKHGQIFVEASSPLFEQIKKVFQDHDWLVKAVYKDFAGHQRVIQVGKS